MFNKLIVALMPLAPRFLVKMVSKRYIAGEDSAAAIAKCLELKARGFLTTLDILGEAISNEQQAEKALEAYLNLITEVVASGITRNISLKPTALGLGLSEESLPSGTSPLLSKKPNKPMYLSAWIWKIRPTPLPLCVFMIN